MKLLYQSRGYCFTEDASLAEPTTNLENTRFKHPRRPPHGLGEIGSEWVANPAPQTMCVYIYIYIHIYIYNVYIKSKCTCITMHTACTALNVCMHLHLDYGCGVESLTFKEKVGLSVSR